MDRRRFLLLPAALPLAATAGLADVRAGRAFAGSLYTEAPKGHYGYAQVWNPPGSGVRCILEGIGFDALDATGFGVNIVGISRPLKDLFPRNGGKGSNRIVGSPRSKCELRREKSAQWIFGHADSPQDIYGNPHASTPWKWEDFRFHAILNPGFGMVAGPEKQGKWICVTWDFIEEPLDSDPARPTPGVPAATRG